MSDIVAAFDPSTMPQTSFTVPQSAVNGALVFWNESNIALTVTLQNGSSFYLPAWYNKHLCGYSGSVNVAWQIRSTLNSGQPPLSEIIVEAYAHGEPFPADGALARQANGNTNTVTTQNTLTNDGSAGGTVFIEATPASGVQSVLVDVSGNATLAGSIQGNNIIAGSSGFSMLDNTNAIKHLIGFNTQNKTLIWLDGADLEVRNADGTLALSYDPSTGQLLFNRSGFALLGPSGATAFSTSLVNTHLNGSNASTLQVGGVDVLQALAGSIICDQRLTLSQAGSISGMTTYSGTTSAGVGVSVNHNMGTTPDVCITSITSGSSTTTYSTTWNATQATVLANFGGLPFKGVAIKL